MADRSGRARVPVLKLRTASSQLIQVGELGARIDNMVPMEEGTLRAVWGPTPYVPEKGYWGAPDIYDQTFGIFHARLQEGAREVLLLHSGTELWEFEGWRRSTAGGGYDGIEWSNVLLKGLDDSNRAQFPTQFVATPNGIVIVPQNRRAHFYDGDAILPLGYATQPVAPTGFGPESSRSAGEESAGGGVNDLKYAHDALPWRPSAMHSNFRHGRLGLVVSPTNYVPDYDNNGKAVIMAWLEPGAWRAKVQWIDRWGNLSPLSGPSEEVTVERQVATGWDAEANNYEGASYYVRGELVRKQIAWAAIPTGPQGTLGRILCRTRDLRQSGDGGYYVVPSNAKGAGNAFATLPDNESSLFPDNIPDSWLFQEPMDVDPVPMFRLAALAFGRLWIANIPGAEGMLRPSLPGRWGTFPVNQEIYPDPSGAEITGLHGVQRGLLVFTRTSTFLIEANDSGDGFRSMPMSTYVGCEAPSSIVSTPDGSVIWLGADGFYSYDGQGISYIFTDMARDAREFNKGRLCQAVAAYDKRFHEYRCWLPVKGSDRNDRCYVYDGLGWRTRTDVTAGGVCVTSDHRNYMLVAGASGDREGVWVLDAASRNWDPPERTSMVETAWLNAENSHERSTVMRVTIWMRERRRSTGESSKVQVDVMRDWRDTVIETATAEVHPTDDPPAFWGDSFGGTWQYARPYWTKVDVNVRAAEVFKFRFRSDDDWEFVGIQFDVAPRQSGGARIPP